MRKTFKKVALFSCILALTGSAFTACKDYDGDINDLQEQITSNNGNLESLSNTLASQIGAANQLANSAQTLAGNANDAAAQALAAAQAAQNLANNAVAGSEEQKQALADLEKSLKEYADQTAEAAKQAAIAEAAAQLAAELKDLNDQMSEMETTLGKVSGDATAALAATVTNAENIAALQGKVKALEDQLASLEVGGVSPEALQEMINETLKDLGLEELPSDVKDLIKQVEELNQQQASLQLQYDTLEKYLENLKNDHMDDMNGLNADIMGLIAQLSGVEDEVGGLNGQVSELQKQLKALQSTVNSMQSLTIEEVMDKVAATYATTASVDQKLAALQAALKQEIADQLANGTSGMTEDDVKALIESYLGNYVTNGQLSQQVNALNKQIQDAIASIDLSGLQNQINKINSNLLAIQTDMLRGLIFFTDLYVGGIPAMDYAAVNYYEFAFAKTNATVSGAALQLPSAFNNTTSNPTAVAVTVPTTNPIYTVTNTPTNLSPADLEYFYPQLQAQYKINPSSAVVERSQLSVITNAVETRATESLGSFDILDANCENGILTLDLTWYRPAEQKDQNNNVIAPSNELSGNYYTGNHNNMLFAVQAEFTVEGEEETVVNTVTSDWGLFNPVSVEPLNGAIFYTQKYVADKPLENPYYQINLYQTTGTTPQTVNGTQVYPLYYTDLLNVKSGNNSSYVGLYNALNEAPTMEVPYNDVLDLNNNLQVVFQSTNYKVDGTPNQQVLISMTPAELSEYGMTMNYALINYTVNGVTYDAAHKAGESSYVTLNEGVLTPNPQTTASLGHMPVVMTWVTDQHGALVALSFVKVIVAYPKTPAPEFNTIDLGVYPFTPGADVWNYKTLNYQTLVSSLAAGQTMTITESQWINNYLTAPTVTTTPSVYKNNFGEFDKVQTGTNAGSITWTLPATNTLSSNPTCVDIWNATANTNRTIVAEVTFEPNVSHLPTITIPVQITVARANVGLGTKISNVWNYQVAGYEDLSYALATLNVQSSGTIPSDVAEFNLSLPGLFNNKQVLDYTLNAIPANPTPVYVNGTVYNNATPDSKKIGLFPSLQLASATSLTIPYSSTVQNWYLTDPGTALTLPEVAYNFYFNQLNNQTVKVSEGYWAGSYNLKVTYTYPTNQVSTNTPLTSQVVLNQPHYLSSTGTEYNNIEVYTTDKSGARHTIFTMNQGNGSITIGSTDGTTPDPLALAILNEKASYAAQGYQSALQAQIGIAAWGNNNWSVSVGDSEAPNYYGQNSNMFFVNFLRPINILMNAKPQSQTWNQTQLSYNLKNFNIQDVPGNNLTASQIAWFDAYQLDLDLPNATYTVYNSVDSNGQGVGQGATYSVTNYLSVPGAASFGSHYNNAFTGEPYVYSSTEANMVPVSVWGSATSFGSIIFDSASPLAETNLVITKPTLITVPAALTYAWGSIFFEVTFWVMPI